MDILNRIKRLVTRGKYRLTIKAEAELALDGLTPDDAIESILNAEAIKKTLRSLATAQHRGGEKLYVIESFNYGGTLIYTKGKITQEAGEEIFYVFISSKRATLGE